MNKLFKLLTILSIIIYSCCPAVNAEEREFDYGPAITPLLQTEWGQNWPYNTQCPFVDGRQAPAGCGACAMAQLVKYFNGPEHFAPEQRPDYFSLPDTDFDFEKMANSYPLSDSDGLDAVEVSKLMLYCGQAVKMDYSSNLSLCDITDCGPALHQMFSFSESTFYPRYRVGLSDYQWGRVLYDHVSNGIPVLFCGRSKTGDSHIFVCDGYLDGDKFHFNMGWNGNSNGYYSLRNLSADNFDYLDAQSYICNLLYLPNLDDSTPCFGEPVETLLSTEWGQSKEWYNSREPVYDEFGVYIGFRSTNCGSAATAMAQVMKFYNHPAAFDYKTVTAPGPWDEMSEYLKSFYNEFRYNQMPESNCAGNDEIWNLLYLSHLCAGSHPGLNNTWALSDSVCHAMKYAFHYPSARLIKRMDYTSWEDWGQVIHDEIKDGRPVIYMSTDDVLKHATMSVIDGYQDGWLFHFNWGNEGTDDGLYDIRRPKGHSAMISAIIGLAPPPSGVDNVLSDIVGDNWQDGFEVYNTSGQIVGKFHEETTAREVLPDGVYILRRGTEVKKIRL